MKEALDQVKQRNPKSLIIGAGCSMGGTILAGYLTHSGKESLLDAVFMASTVWDCVAGTKNLETGWLNPKISTFLCAMLVKLVRRHQHMFEQYPEFVAEDLDRVKTIRDFDTCFTSKM